MQPSGSSDVWKPVADTIHFSVPACIEDFAVLVPLNARILELGCGYGRITRLLRDYGFTDVTGYDSSPSMIERGHRENSDLTLRLNSHRDLPEPDDAADAVVCCAVLTCIPDVNSRQAVIRDIERVLRPGGILHVVEFAENADRRYASDGRFMSGLGIEMVHFTQDRLTAEVSSFQEIATRQIDCRSVSGSSEKAIMSQARKRANQALEPTSLLVTPRASARVAPISAAAHL